MAEEFQVGKKSKWWDTSRNNTRFGENDDETPSTSATLNSTSRSSEISSMFLLNPQSLPIHQESSGSLTAGGRGRGGGAHPNLQIMGLGLSSEAMDWNNQPLYRDEMATRFRWMLKNQMSSNTYFHDYESAEPSDQDHWRQKLQAAADNYTDDSSPKDYKQLTHRQGFSLDKTYNDYEAAYEDQSLFEGGLLALDNHHHPSNSSWNNCGVLAMPRHPSSNTNVSYNKFPPSPSKQQHDDATGQLQFSNNRAAINDVRSSFLPLLQTQLPTPTFDEQQKNTTYEIQTETSNKRPRRESSSHNLPAFKVRKEKMGDRINALQQLVSPFGKTDTASVLSEAIEYIKFLHDQVNVLSTPYMRSGDLVQNQKHLGNKVKDTEDLRSRGLCLVPVSITFPLTHQTTSHFWTPTFGPTFT